MPSKKYAAPLSFEPQRSRWLALLSVVSVGGAVWGVLVVPAPLPLRLAALVAIAVLAFDLHRRAFGKRRIVRVVWDELSQWQLELADGSTWEVALDGDSVITPEVMVLAFRAPRRRFSLVLLGDALHAETRRRLRVRLRLESMHRGEKDAATGDA